MKAKLIRNLAAIAVIALFAQGAIGQINVVNGLVGVTTNTPLDNLHLKLGNSGGTPYQSKGLTIENSERCILQFLSPSDKDQFIMFGDAGASNRAWISYKHNTEEMHLYHYGAAGKFIFSNGNVGIGRTPSATHKLDINGTLRVDQTTYPSDVRYKKDIKDLNSNLDDIFLLRPVSYKMKKTDSSNIMNTQSTEVLATQDVTPGDTTINEDTNNQTRFGFIAQELREVYPELVIEDETGYLSIDYVSLIPIMLAAMKQQNERIEALEELVKQNKK